MNDPIALTLNSPITEEQWDIITDVDLDNTPRIIFQTKHGKEVEYVKVVRCEDCKFFRAFAEPYMDFEPDGYCNIYESTEGFEHFCSYGERRNE